MPPRCAICLRARYAMSGTDLAYGGHVTRPKSGSGRGSARVIPAMGLRACYAMSDTDTAHVLTSHAITATPLAAYALATRSPALTKRVLGARSRFFEGFFCLLVAQVASRYGQIKCNNHALRTLCPLSFDFAAQEKQSRVGGKAVGGAWAVYRVGPLLVELEADSCVGAMSWSGGANNVIGTPA
eukprot:403667-Rhodomonas_salina.4